MRDECMFCMMAERCGKAKDEEYEHLCEKYLMHMIDEGRKEYMEAWNSYINDDQDFSFDF